MGRLSDEVDLPVIFPSPKNIRISAQQARIQSKEVKHLFYEGFPHVIFHWLSTNLSTMLVVDLKALNQSE
jgi:hypothetical protein